MSRAGLNRLVLAACLATCVFLQGCIGSIDSMLQGDHALPDCSDASAGATPASTCASG